MEDRLEMSIGKRNNYRDPVPNPAGFQEHYCGNYDSANDVAQLNFNFTQTGRPYQINKSDNRIRLQTDGNATEPIQNGFRAKICSWCE